jgi:hypothetical protein
MNMNPANMVKPDANIAKMLSLIKVDNSYPEIDLVAVSILLGKGSRDSKAKEVWETWNVDCNDILSVEEFRNALKRLISIAVDILPQVAIGAAEDKMTLEKHDEYIASVKKGEAAGIEKVIDDVFGA